MWKVLRQERYTVSSYIQVYRFHQCAVEKMDGTQVRQLIQKWRELNADLTEFNRKIEESRSSINTLKSEYTNSSERWEMEKTGIRTTIKGILDEVSSKRIELQKMEAESNALECKVADRMKRNADHQKIISNRKISAELKIKEVDEQDSEVKNRVELFRANRNDLKSQLLSSIQKLNAEYVLDKEKHEECLAEIVSKSSGVRAAIDHEKKSWILEQGMRCWSAKSEMLQILNEESVSAVSGKKLWSDVILEVNHLENSGLHELTVLESFLAQ